MEIELFAGLGDSICEGIFCGFCDLRNGRGRKDLKKKKSDRKSLGFRQLVEFTCPTVQFRLSFPRIGVPVSKSGPKEAVKIQPFQLSIGLLECLKKDFFHG